MCRYILVSRIFIFSKQCYEKSVVGAVQESLFCGKTVTTNCQAQISHL